MTESIVGVWIAALLTIGIMSFLYRDNIVYKMCEAIFIGVSAGYWFVLYFWDSLYRPVAQGLQDHSYWFIVGILLGLMLLTRLFGKIGWIARWPLAFIIGATCGLRGMTYLATNALGQAHGTVVDTVVAVQTGNLYDIIGRFVIVIGTITGLVYFYFSKEHRGAFGGLAKVGTWFLMITFGASFGYTVMSRMSLLLGRIDFLLTDWLRLVR